MDFETASLEELDAAQRKAARHRDGPLIVLAGPGSGKTRENGVAHRGVAAGEKDVGG